MALIANHTYTTNAPLPPPPAEADLTVSSTATSKVEEQTTGEACRILVRGFAIEPVAKGRSALIVVMKLANINARLKALIVFFNTTPTY